MDNGLMGYLGYKRYKRIRESLLGRKYEVRESRRYNKRYNDLLTDHLEEEEEKFGNLDLDNIDIDALVKLSEEGI